MEKIKVTVETVKVFDNSEYPTVQLVFKESIKGYSKTDDGSYKEKDVNYVSINRGQLTRELCANHDLIDEYRSCRNKAFDQKAFSLILRGATLTIVRTAHTEGEVITDSEGNNVVDNDNNPIAYSRDCYTTNIVAAYLTQRAEEKLDRACTLD